MPGPSARRLPASSVEKSSGRQKMKASDWSRLARRIATPTIVVALWQVLVGSFGWGGGFVPTPVNVMQTLGVWVFGFGSSDRYAGTWLNAVIASSERAFGGFLAASIVGIAVGMLIGRSKTVADFLDPIIQLLRPVPVSAWVPFSLVFFGIGPASAVFLVSLGAFFPVVMNTISGARHVSELHLRSARMLGAGRWYAARRVILPSSLPSILVGLRLALGLSWVLLIVAEMVAVKSGLGYELWNAYYYSRMDVIVAAMITIGLLGYFSDAALVFLSARLLAWHEATDQ
jgi:NitT/TauT family transport system permease protein